jgi:predicted GTPase
MSKKNVIIIGAAGRDFHNFNTCYRDNENFNVVAFTAAQIPDIDGRKYPSGLAGKLYPQGIPIFDESNLTDLIKKYKVDECVFSYSDVTYQKVMSVSAIVNAAGANFILLGPADTMVKSNKPVIAVGAIRTGCGKSQTSRKVIELLMDKGLKVVAVRHPMPYGTPTTVLFGGTSLKTTAFAATLELSPTVNGPRTFAPAPTSTLLPIVGCLLPFSFPVPPKVTP